MLSVNTTTIGFLGGAWMAAATGVIWTFGDMILLPAAPPTWPRSRRPTAETRTWASNQMAFSLAMFFGSSAGTAALVRLGGPVFWALTFPLGIFSAGLRSRIPQAAQHHTVAVANGEPA